MSEPTRSRRWGQFGLRFVFVAVLVTAAFCAGYVLREHNVQQLAARQAALRRQNDDLEQRNLELQLELIQRTTSPFLEELTSVVVEEPDGHVVRVSSSGELVWIDLGSADGLRRQQSFSVYAKQETDFQNAMPKATIEIDSVDGPKTAQARVVSKVDDNPIAPQDVIFSPTWQPGQRLHFALAGKLDYNDDGVADNGLIKDLILTNGGIVDAEVDEHGRRTGTVSITTRYLVVGDPPSDQPDAAVNNAYNELLSQAEELGIEPIVIKHLLEMGCGPRPGTERSASATPRFRPRNAAASAYP